MKKEIVLITGNNKFFGQTRKPWVSLDLNKIEFILKQNKIKFRQYEFHEIFNSNIEISNTIIFYTFSQKPEIRKYIADILNLLESKNNILIPDIEFHRCHENKGYQELYKSKLGIKSLKAYYFSNIRDLKNYIFNFPIVLKTVEGSNGKGVYLINTEEELWQKVKSLKKIGAGNAIDLIRRKYLRKKKVYKEYPEYNNKTDYYQYKNYIFPNKRFILQEYVPQLKFDYRVLVMFDKFFVVKRHTRKNDFRASGTKIFDFNIDIDIGLLDYAKEIFRKFNSPFLSLDIVFDDKNYFLIEYQALHFGINVYTKNPRYFKFEKKSWISYEHHPDFENDMTMALIKYINSL